jgi:hypothetical protein
VSRNETNQKKVAAVVDLLLQAGWVHDGRTREETVRVGTNTSPIYGGTGGELRTFGGRVRMVDHRSSEPTRKVTIGPVTTYFYEILTNRVQNPKHLRTSDLGAIRLAAGEKLVDRDTASTPG